MMDKRRLESFSDGVMAVIITIMVLELKAPRGADLGALRPLLAVFVSYVMSFVFIGEYWNNHHHMLSATKRVSGAVLWANLHLLFWLSLVPFVTRWMGENEFAAVPTALYGVVLFMAALAFFLVERAIVAGEGSGSLLATAVGAEFKGKLSLALYAIAIPSAFVRPWIAGGLYAAVALMWLIPDRRIEAAVSGGSGDGGDAQGAV